MANDNVKQLELNGRLYDYSDEVARASIDELAQRVNPILPLDTEPTANSAKGITSGGVKTALNLRPIIHKESFSFVFNTNGTCTQSNWGITAARRETEDGRNIAWWNFTLPTRMAGKVLCFTMSHWSQVNVIPYITGDDEGHSIAFTIKKEDVINKGTVTVDIVYMD